MPILEDKREANASDLAAAVTIAQAECDRLEAERSEQIRNHRWSDARAITVKLVGSAAWLSALTKYQAGLPAAGKPSVTAAEELRAIADAIAGEYRAAVARAKAHPTLNNVEAAFSRGRQLYAVTSDFCDLTGTPKVALAMVANTRVDLAELRDRLELRPAFFPNQGVKRAVDRSRWLHLVS